jgi:hypothetical protein
MEDDPLPPVDAVLNTLRKAHGIGPKRFELGEVLLTPGVEAGVDKQVYVEALAQHQAARWGVVPLEDAKENDRRLERGELTWFTSAWMIHPEYTYVQKSIQLFLITTEGEGEHRVTTLYTPDER